MGLSKGAVVTITGDGLYHKGLQGEVVEIRRDNDPDGPICVRFPNDMARSYGDPEIIRFQEREVRQDVEWIPENLATKLFGRNFHSLNTLTFPFGASVVCMHEGCGRRPYKRAHTNIWGTVAQVDVCRLHYREYHGKCKEIFPLKKDVPTRAHPLELPFQKIAPRRAVRS